MEKYKPIRQLMAEGQFSKALDHLSRILQKAPDNEEVRQLEYTCREMIHIKNACKDEPEQKNAISTREYVSVHFRCAMKKICHWVFYLLTKLPLKWQQKIKADRFRAWEIRFTLDSDSQKDWLWELLFWDAKRRVIVFFSLIAIILLSLLLFILLASGGCNSDSPEGKNFSNTVKAAYAGDAQAQFLLGKKFYYGENVKKDADQALLWLTKAARSGHTQAAALLQKILVKQDIRTHEGQNIWSTNDIKKSGSSE